ncbi:MAG: tetratricopeptide repeat protein [Elusimicrobiota bacterium]|nr:tetratricopeptide repeat protein [Elusimicrobiota bacterium]
MSTLNEKNSWAAPALLAAAGLAVALLVWRSYHRDAPRVTAYTAPPAATISGALQVETAETLHALAETHLAARRFSDAQAVYRKILALDPKNASVYNELGLVLHYQGKSDEALEALKTATTLDPGLQRAWLSYGFVLKSTGKDAQARLALEKTVALGASTPQGVEARSMLER